MSDKPPRILIRLPNPDYKENPIYMDTLQISNAFQLPTFKADFLISKESRSSAPTRATTIRWRKARNQHEAEFLCAILPGVKEAHQSEILRERLEQLILADSIGWKSVKDLETFRDLGFPVDQKQKYVSDAIQKKQTKRSSKKGYRQSFTNKGNATFQSGKSK